jgi:cell division septum initiation protein DivIVA
MTLIQSIDYWFECVKRGTNGDQVYDILYSWKEDRRKLLLENKNLKKELEELRQTIQHIGQGWLSV